LGIASELDPPVSRVWTGNIQLVGGEAFRVLKNSYYAGIFFHSVTKHVGNDCGSVRAQRRELFRNEHTHSHVLQAHGVEHSGGRFTEPRSRGARDRFEGESFDHYSAEAVEIHQVGKLDAVSEGAAGGNDGIGKAQRANVDGEVHCAGQSHCGNISTHARDPTRRNCGKIEVVRRVPITGFETGSLCATMIGRCASLKKTN
jgi:hypothetical protein